MRPRGRPAVAGEVQPGDGHGDAIAETDHRDGEPMHAGESTRCSRRPSLAEMITSVRAACAAAEKLTMNALAAGRDPQPADTSRSRRARHRVGGDHPVAVGQTAVGDQRHELTAAGRRRCRREGIVPERAARPPDHVQQTARLLSEGHRHVGGHADPVTQRSAEAAPAHRALDRRAIGSPIEYFSPVIGIWLPGACSHLPATSGGMAAYRCTWRSGCGRRGPRRSRHRRCGSPG